MEGVWDGIGWGGEGEGLLNWSGGGGIVKLSFNFSKYLGGAG